MSDQDRTTDGSATADPARHAGAPNTADGADADRGAIDRAQAAIDDAKDAAAKVDLPGEPDLVDEGAPVADDAEPSDGPAPAA